MTSDRFLCPTCQGSLRESPRGGGWACSLCAEEFPIVHGIPRIMKGVNYVERGILDTFDMLSPRYDRPQTLGAVRHWFVEAGLDRIEVQYGPNRINGKGMRTTSAAAP